MKSVEKLINQILVDVELLMDSNQLATLKVVLTVECTKYSITEQKKEADIFNYVFSKKGANAPVKVIDRFPQMNQHHKLLHPA